MAGEPLRSALVTGASSGIGAACVRALTASGVETWALARRIDRLEALAAETGCIPLSADLMDAEGTEAALSHVAPDILINNAGLGAGITGLATASPGDVARTIGTNVEALLQVTRALLPGMIERGRGHIVNMGSVAGSYPINSAIYGGSKGAVRMISQNLRLELRGTGIRVSEIAPGRVTTEFFEVAVPDPGPNVPTTLPITSLTPEDIADAVMFAVNAPPHVNVSLVEVQPTEQYFGGVHFDPLEWTDG
ncbi:MAG: SDR family oxidoreductase [Pseudomonadota bacterium]